MIIFLSNSCMSDSSIDTKTAWLLVQNVDRFLNGGRKLMEVLRKSFKIGNRKQLFEVYFERGSAYDRGYQVPSLGDR